MLEYTAARTINNVEWTKLADAVALFEKVGRDGTINRLLEKLLRKGDSTEYDIEYRCRISSLPAYRLVQNTTGMFRGQDKRGVRTWRYTLEELVCFLAAFEASRPHDAIYAVLGLASDIRPATASEERSIYTKNLGPRANRPRQDIKGFNVDYEMPPLVIFKTFMKHVIETSGSLDIICRPWAPDKVRDTEGNYQPINLPSWIPTISKKTFQRTQKGNMIRRNPNPLVGAKSFRHKFYNASGSRKVIWSENIITDDSNLMTVKGFKLGEIKEIWPNNTTGNVPAEWLTAGGWDSDMEYPPEDLWRTLVADRNRQDGDAEPWYPMALLKGNTAVAELFRRIRAVVWGRSLIRVEGGFMSWLAGECYVNHMMDGEAIAYLEDKEGLMEEEFKLK
ncbi:hypothetical protein F4809DRAFT_644502 [Biscogniauxia mediterranea]|nr:hypothetical protein F4809DRAFT_644502 [Biscogniauxia mediterranea]